MRMIRPGVHLELDDLPRRELVLGKHPLDRLTDHFLRAPGQLLRERARPQPAGIPAVAVGPLLPALGARHVNPLGVDHDAAMPWLDVWRVPGPAPSPPQDGGLG